MDNVIKKYLMDMLQAISEIELLNLTKHSSFSTMRIMRNIIIYIVAALVSIGCVRSSDSYTNSDLDLKKLVIIDPDACEGDTTIILSSIIDSLQVINLCGWSAPAGYMYKLEVSDAHAVMIPYSDTDSVKLLDFHGNSLFAFPMPSYTGNVPSIVDAVIDEPRQRVYLSKQGEIIAYNFDGSEYAKYTIKQIHNPSLFLYPDGNLAVVSMCFSDLGDTVAVARFNPDMEVNGVDDITVCHYPPLQAGVSSMGSLYDVTDTKSFSSKMLFSFALTNDTTYYYDEQTNQIYPHITLSDVPPRALVWGAEFPSGYVAICRTNENQDYYWLDKHDGKVRKVSFFNDYIGTEIHPYFLFGDEYMQCGLLKFQSDYFKEILAKDSLTSAQRQLVESILNYPDNSIIVLRGKITHNKL